MSWWNPQTVLESRLHTRVLVTLKSGTSFAGVLFTEDPRALVLRDATAIGAGERRTDLPLDGEVIVLIAEIDFIQRP